MPNQGEFLANPYDENYSSRLNRLERVHYVQERITQLKGNLKLLREGILQQHKDIAQNNTVIAKTTVRGLNEDITLLKEKLGTQEQICKNAVGHDLIARLELIKKINMLILKKHVMIADIEALQPGEVLTVVKMAQETLPKQKENLKRFQQEEARLEKEIASKEAELKELRNDAGYMPFFQHALPQKIVKKSVEDNFIPRGNKP